MSRWTNELRQADDVRYVKDGGTRSVPFRPRRVSLVGFAGFCALLLILCAVLSSIGVVYLSDTQDTYKTKIVCTNGNVYDATGPNFQLALQSMTTGGKINVPNGTMWTTHTIYNNNSFIEIIGSGNSILKCTAGATTTLGLITFRDCHNVLMRGMILDGNMYGGGYTAGTWVGGVRDTEYIRITECIIRNTTSGGIFASQVNHSSFDHNTLINIGNISYAGGVGRTGIVLDQEPAGCFNNTVAYNDISHVREHGIKNYAPTGTLTKPTGNKIIGNIISDTNLGEIAYPALYGTGIECQAAGSLIDGNYIYMNALTEQGIVTSNNNNIITNNHIIWMTTTISDQSGILVTGSSGYYKYSHNNTVSNNYINASGVSGTGILLKNTDYNIISENHVKGVYYPLQMCAVNNNVSHNQILNNIFSGNRNSFYEDASGTEYVRNNIFIGNDLTQITLAAKFVSDGGNLATMLANNSFLYNIGYNIFEVATSAPVAIVPGAMWINVTTGFIMYYNAALVLQHIHPGAS